MIRRVSHCSHWGAYTVLVEEGRIVGVEPFKHDPAPSPVIHSVTDWAKPERRILRPMVREGWLAAREGSNRRGRGNERFVPVSWDEATDLVAGEIHRVSRDHGNASIFAGSYGWTSCGRFHHASTLLKRMMNLAGSYTGHVDTYSIAAGPVILRHRLGDERACGGQSNTLDTIAEHSETLLVFGAMSPRTAQSEAGGIGAHYLEGYLRQIAERGVKVIHVSPYREDLPDWAGAEWWPIRPNTDTALMLGLAGEIVLAGQHDASFLGRCTSGSDQLLAYLRGEDDGQAKTADWAAAITGLDAQAIRDLAQRLTDTRMVYWAGGNPFHHHQDLNRLSEAWTRPETIIVQDPMFTATARRADIVLPASTSLERNDLGGNKRSDFILAMAKAIEPMGEARADFDMFNAIAEKLGVAPAFNEGRDEMGWIRHIYTESRDFAAQGLGFGMPDFDTFWAQGHAACPVQRDHTYLAEYRADPAAHPLNTESGRIVLGSDMLARLGYADCRAHPAWIEPAEWLGGAVEGELHLISHQPNGRLHSQLETAEGSLADKRGGREQVRLNPVEAAPRGIADGATVRLWNARGACLATACVTDAVAPGVAILPTGAWFTPADGGPELSGNPNVLTLDIGTSAFGQACSAHTCLVRVEPYKGAAPDAARTYQHELADICPPLKETSP